MLFNQSAYRRYKTKENTWDADGIVVPCDEYRKSYIKVSVQSIQIDKDNYPKGIELTKSIKVLTKDFLDPEKDQIVFENKIYKILHLEPYQNGSKLNHYQAFCTQIGEVS